MPDFYSQRASDCFQTTICRRGRDVRFSINSNFCRPRRLFSHTHGLSIVKDSLLLRSKTLWLTITAIKEHSKSLTEEDVLRGEAGWGEQVYRKCQLRIHALNIAVWGDLTALHVWMFPFISRYSRDLFPRHAYCIPLPYIYECGSILFVRKIHATCP